jgi:Family of unknown function (DUF5677)
LDREELVLDAPETLTDVNRVADECEEIASRMKFDRNNSYHLLLVGAFLSLVERARAIAVLIEHGMTSDARTILRALLETGVEIIYLCDDKEREFNSQFNFVKSMLIRLREAKRGNKYYSGFSATIDIDAEIKKWERKKKEVVDAGGKQVGIEDKFKVIGWSDEYEAIYRSHSDAIHPSFAGMIDRSFRIVNNDEGHQIVLYKEAEPETMNVICHTTCRILTNSVERLKNASNTGGPKLT